MLVPARFAHFEKAKFTIIFGKPLSALRNAYASGNESLTTGSIYALLRDSNIAPNSIDHSAVLLISSFWSLEFRLSFSKREPLLSNINFTTKTSIDLLTRFSFTLSTSISMRIYPQLAFVLSISQKPLLAGGQMPWLFGVPFVFFTYHTHSVLTPSLCVSLLPSRYF